MLRSWLCLPDSAERETNGRFSLAFRSPWSSDRSQVRILTLAKGRWANGWIGNLFVMTHIGALIRSRSVPHIAERTPIGASELTWKGRPGEVG